MFSAGALYIRRRPRVRLEAQMSGGGQERGLRSGTLPHPLIVGFGAACRIASEEMEHDHRWARAPSPLGEQSQSLLTVTAAVARLWHGSPEGAASTHGLCQLASHLQA